jgi:ATP/maltotriose-dependent transcriptional regulator MalT
MDLSFVSVCVLTNLAQILRYLGRFDEARTAGGRAALLAHRQGDVRLVGSVALFLAGIDYAACDYPAAETQARLSLEAFTHVPPLQPAGLAALSRALLKQGRPAEALDCAEKANQALEILGHVEDGEALVRLALIEAQFAAGDTDRARKTLATARTRLLERASAIHRDDWRDSFLTRVPEHARTLELAVSIAWE